MPPFVYWIVDVQRSAMWLAICPVSISQRVHRYIVCSDMNSVLLRLVIVIPGDRLIVISSKNGWLLDPPTTHIDIHTFIVSFAYS